MSDGERSRFSRKIDNLFRAVFFAEDGKPKSALLLYSFSLALVFILVFIASYLFLLGPLERALSSRSVLLRNIVEYTVPAIAGCIPCLALSFAFRLRMNMVPAAFTWIDVIVIIMFITMALTAGKEDRAAEFRMFMNVLGIPMLVSAVLGTAGSQMIYRKRRGLHDRLSDDKDSQAV